MPGWVIAPSANITRNYKRILQMTRKGSTHAASESSNSRTIVKSKFALLVYFIAGNL